MDWKEQLKTWTYTIHIPGNPARLITTKLEPEFLQDFISDLLEKVIEDIPEGTWGKNGMGSLKQQLRDKYL
jgi:hypothetical protein